MVLEVFSKFNNSVILIIFFFSFLNGEKIDTFEFRSSQLFPKKWTETINRSDFALGF